jgi:hypothetical protein
MAVQKLREAQSAIGVDSEVSELSAAAVAVPIPGWQPFPQLGLG